MMLERLTFWLSLLGDPVTEVLDTRGSGRRLLHELDRRSVDILEEPRPAAEKHGRERDVELVDEPRAEILVDRLRTAADAHVAALRHRARLPQRALDPIVHEMERRAARA